MIGNLLGLLLVGREAHSLLKSAWDSFHHLADLLRLHSTLTLDQGGCLYDESNNFLSSLIRLEVRIDRVSMLVVSDCFIIAFKILKDGCSVVVKIGVLFLLKSFSLGVGLQSESKFGYANTVDKEIGEMCVTKYVPRLSITKIERYSFAC